MLQIFSPHMRAGTCPDLDQDLDSHAVWIDLIDATPEERKYVEQCTGLYIPTMEDLSEIETSSRLYVEDGAVFMSTPLLVASDINQPRTTPAGFVLSPKYLITVRFADLKAWKTTRDKLIRMDAALITPGGILATLLDSQVDRLADVLEKVGADLDAVSKRIFRTDTAAATRRPAQEDANLRRKLQSIGQSGDLVSKIRECLLGIGRICPYLCGNAPPSSLTSDTRQHIATLATDVASLNDYDAFLSNKVQFLLDATLGLINIEQNNIIKVLTIVSVVGVPPTLVASMYGMNFKNMPELSWSWGYPYGLAMILISAIGPLLWFKWKGWL
ncbi:MAG TPA: magnesium transporter CorA family protein [Stellaceae bacterium]|nr:magnesium transporter CorA family protein [Stellaceae bacterium]